MKSKSNDFGYIFSVSGSLILILLGNILNVFFNLLLMRILTINDFGLFASANYLLVLIGFISMSIQSVVALETANVRQGDRFNVSSDVRYRLILIISILAMLVSIVTLGILSFFVSGNFKAYFPIAFYFPAAFTLAFAFGKMQGKNKIQKLNALSLIANIFKFAALIPFFFMDSDVGVLVFGMVLSSFVSAVIALRITSDIGPIKIRLHYTQARNIGVLGCLIWFGLGSDVLFSRLALNSQEAGIYSIQATIARLCVLGIMTLSFHEYNFFAHNWPNNFQVCQSRLKRVFRNSLLLFSIFSLGLLTTGDLVLNIVLGDFSVINKWDIFEYQLALFPLVFVLPLYYLTTSRIGLFSTICIGLISLLSAAAAIFLANNREQLLLIVFITGVSMLVLFLNEKTRQERFVNEDI